MKSRIMNTLEVLWFSPQLHDSGMHRCLDTIFIGISIGWRSYWKTCFVVPTYKWCPCFKAVLLQTADLDRRQPTWSKSTFPSSNKEFLCRRVSYDHFQLLKIVSKAFPFIYHKMGHILSILEWAGGHSGQWWWGQSDHLTVCFNLSLSVLTENEGRSNWVLETL